MVTPKHPAPSDQTWHTVLLLVLDFCAFPRIHIGHWRGHSNFPWWSARPENHHLCFVIGPHQRVPGLWACLSPGLSMPALYIVLYFLRAKTPKTLLCTPTFHYTWSRPESLHFLLWGFPALASCGRFGRNGGVALCHSSLLGLKLHTLPACLQSLPCWSHIGF